MCLVPVITPSCATARLSCASNRHHSVGDHLRDLGTFFVLFGATGTPVYGVTHSARLHVTHNTFRGAFRKEGGSVVGSSVLEEAYSAAETIVESSPKHSTAKKEQKKCAGKSDPDLASK